MELVLIPGTVLRMKRSRSHELVGSLTLRFFAGGCVVKLPRRKFLYLAAGAATLPIASRMAKADHYPSRPVHVLVGFPPGGGADIHARLIGQSLSERLGQQFVVENRPGASNNIATEAAVRSSPDGYTLLWITSANAINAALYEKLNFDFRRDIAPVASVVTTPGVMEVNPTVPIKTVPEFMAYAKANAGKVNYASGGNGTPSHLAGELFKMMTGVDMVHVPYRGVAPALTDLLGGRVQVMFETISSSIEYIKGGKLNALAVTSAMRSQALPDVPTVGEFLPGYEASTWYGVGAPNNTPIEIVDTLNNEVNATLDDPKLKSRLVDLGGTVFAGSPAAFGKFIADETEKWAKVIKFAGIKPS
jgi:tripartite-type tricarboxylate transporter receptor subunit TctC